MAWVVLVLSGMFETVWALALAQSDGFKKLVPTIVFFIACTISMGGLAYALKTLPVGTGYAIWVGIGAIGTAAYGMVMLGEPATVARIVCLILIVAGVVGLKLVH